MSALEWFKTVGAIVTALAWTAVLIYGIRVLREGRR